MLARQGELTPAEVTKLFAEGGGGRIAALAVMRERPSPQRLSLAVDAVAHSRSAFEQWQALRAIEQMLPTLTADQLRQVVAVIEEQRSGGEGNTSLLGSIDGTLVNVSSTKLTT